MIRAVAGIVLCIGLLAVGSPAWAQTTTAPTPSPSAPTRPFNPNCVGQGPGVCVNGQPVPGNPHIQPTTNNNPPPIWTATPWWVWFVIAAFVGTGGLIGYGWWTQRSRDRN